jgi:hypothetical protein
LLKAEEKRLCSAGNNIHTKFDCIITIFRLFGHYLNLSQTQFGMAGVAVPFMIPVPVVEFAASKYGPASI